MTERVADMCEGVGSAVWDMGSMGDEGRTVETTVEEERRVVETTGNSVEQPTDVKKRRVRKKKPSEARSTAPAEAAADKVLLTTLLSVCLSRCLAV